MSSSIIVASAGHLGRVPVVLAALASSVTSIRR
jgi:hypothetical protein